MAARDDHLAPAPEQAPDLMARVARGDEAAFAKLYDELAPRVYGLCRRIVRDPAQAEEVAQEALVEVWRTAAGTTRRRAARAPGCTVVLSASLNKGVAVVQGLPDP